MLGAMESPPAPLSEDDPFVAPTAGAAVMGTEGTADDGAAEGAVEGRADEGAAVGSNDGLAVMDPAVGLAVGAAEGRVDEGAAVGSSVGASVVGLAVGLAVGSAEGAVVGSSVGATPPSTLTCEVAQTEGTPSRDCVRKGLGPGRCSLSATVSRVLRRASALRS